MLRRVGDTVAWEQGGVVDERPWWIVVGGRTRLGRCVAESLAADHKVLVTTSRPEGPESGWETSLSTRNPARILRWDAADARLVPRMMADLAQVGAEGIRFRGALVAAGTFPRQPFGTWDPESLARTWELNLTFPLLVAQALAPHFEDGATLQFFLDTALHRPFREHLPYSAAKAALGALVPALAREFAPRVRVAGHALGVLLPEEGCDAEGLAARNLTQRNGTPDDLIRAIRYVADSPYLTGEILTLDGGRRWA